jgi:hypothetical protein
LNCKLEKLRKEKRLRSSKSEKNLTDYIRRSWKRKTRSLRED